jgi:ribosomal protein L16 Arg81 hydroxylase
MQSTSANLALAAARTEAQKELPSRFRDTISLQSLVSPVSEEEFRARYWEKKPLVVHRADPGYYGDLFTLQDFDANLTRCRGYVKTAEATTKKQSKHQGVSATALEQVLTDMRDGHTLILDGIQDFDAKIGLFCRLLAQQTGARFQTNIYLTPPNGKGFLPHWDNHDVFVMQVMGSKHWKVEKDRRTLPEKEGYIEDEGREFRGDVHSFTLNQGDVVYIPRGYVHAAECGSESSLHLTLGIYPNTWDELLSAAVKMAILRDESLRLALPFGHMEGDGAGIVNRLMDTLKTMTDRSFLTTVLDQFRDESIKRAPLDISGQLLSFYQAAQIKLDDQVGARAGLFYTMRKRQEGVTLNIGTRAITFPDFFAPALQFALTTPAFAIRELPGELEDEERVVFVERLMQEGLVVRK